MSSIDLNADLGEGFGVWRMADDAALFELVTSANVACGFHAGDPPTMRRCARAAELGVRIGAHVSYRDLTGFGGATWRSIRSNCVMRSRMRSPGSTAWPARRYAGELRQSHGRAAHPARTIRSMRRHWSPARSSRPEAALLGLPGSVVLRVAAEAGVPTVTEGYPDRRYTVDGRLAPRNEPGSVLSEPDEVSSNAIRLAAAGDVASLCLHGDNPAALELARRTREALLSAGTEVAAFT